MAQALAGSGGEVCGRAGHPAGTSRMRADLITCTDGLHPSCLLKDAVWTGPGSPSYLSPADFGEHPTFPGGGTQPLLASSLWPAVT